VVEDEDEAEVEVLVQLLVLVLLKASTAGAKMQLLPPERVGEVCFNPF
jgi:hypothetical protein